MKRHTALWTVIVAAFLCSTDLQAQEMSIPPTDFSGHLVFRQHGNETNKSVFKQFLTLIPKHLIPEEYFEKTSPAAYYSKLPREIVLHNETHRAVVIPPFSRFEFPAVPNGEYWLCKFNRADEIDIKNIEAVQKFMLSGCQFVDIAGKDESEYNYYSDEFGLWIDDFPEAQPAPKPALPPITQGEGSCSTQ